jgi:uncharacterized protein YebE (UPF0316 family)
MTAQHAYFFHRQGTEIATSFNGRGSAKGVICIVYVWMAVIQIFYVALNSLRMVLMIKGWKLVASLISMIEICIYILGLTIVLNLMETPLGIIIYSASYGVGILIGVYLEEKIAIGYIALQIVTQHAELPDVLRKHKFGVTTWTGIGANGPRTVLLVFAKRKEYPSLIKIIKEVDEHAFLISLEPRKFMGGFWIKKTGV